MPTRPRSGFRLRDARTLPALDGPAPITPSATAAREREEAEARGELDPQPPT
ncbi:MAG: hypothetical protein JOZ69_12500 [Myxococcales bacterium]|nr:hypothetical protein [Myxococcales bacterium]